MIPHPTHPPHLSTSIVIVIIITAVLSLLSFFLSLFLPFFPSLSFFLSPIYPTPYALTHHRLRACTSIPIINTVAALPMPERFFKRNCYCILSYGTIPRSKQASKKGKFSVVAVYAIAVIFKKKKKKKTRTIHTYSPSPSPSPRVHTIRTNMTLAYRLTPAHSPKHTGRSYR